MDTPVTVLFLSANPSDSSPLRLGEEMRSIQEKIRASTYRESFRIEQEWAVRIPDIQSHLLRHKPHIVHFSGHGSSSNELIFEDDNKISEPTSVESLSTLFCLLKDNIRCVILNACYSDLQAQAIAQHIDCVIGMSREIDDVAAINFSAAFYQAIGFGKDIKTAFDLGCLQVDLKKLDQQDVPKLLAPKCNPKDIVLTRNVDVKRKPQPSDKETTEERQSKKIFVIAAGILTLLFTLVFSTFVLFENKPEYGFGDFPIFFSLGAGGAASLELLKLYEYRGKLTEKKFQAMLHSHIFWIIVLGMLVASGFLTWAFHAGTQNVAPWVLVITGIAIRSTVREVLSSQFANSKTKLGGEQSLRDIFS